MLIYGEMGLAKTDVAALIHYTSADRNQVVAAVEAVSLDDQGSLLFGTDERPGLLHWIGRGTLILRDIDLVSQCLSRTRDRDMQSSRIRQRAVQLSRTRDRDMQCSRIRQKPVQLSRTRDICRVLGYVK